MLLCHHPAGQSQRSSSDTWRFCHGVAVVPKLLDYCHRDRRGRMRPPPDTAKIDRQALSSITMFRDDLVSKHDKGRVWPFAFSATNTGEDPNTSLVRTTSRGSTRPPVQQLLCPPHASELCSEQLAREMTHAATRTPTGRTHAHAPAHNKLQKK